MWMQDVSDREVRKKKKYPPIYKRNYRRKVKKKDNHISPNKKS